jgi:3-oxoacyl-[acyl-carrier protein] reductase
LNAPETEVVCITGTSKGIGAYLAEHFSKAGYLVEGCSRSTVESSLENYHHNIVDVTDENQVKRTLMDIERRHQRLDILINNAGIASMNHILLTPVGVIEKILATNFLGTFLFCREAAKIMRKRRYGRIVNFSTVAVPLRLEGEAIYAASKSAVVTFTQILAKEVASFGITCNVIQPSPIETDLIRNVPKEKIEHIIQQLTIKRLGKFEDIANVVDFYVRRESDYITGQVITLGGI